MSCDKCDDLKEQIEALEEDVQCKNDEIEELEGSVSDLQCEINSCDYSEFNFEEFAQKAFEAGSKTNGSLKEWLDYRLIIRGTHP